MRVDFRGGPTLDKYLSINCHFHRNPSDMSPALYLFLDSQAASIRAELNKKRT